MNELETSDRGLLSALLRSRPGTIAELAGNTPLHGQALDAALARLAALGFVERLDDALTIPAPDGVVGQLAAAAVADHRARLASIEGMLAAPLTIEGGQQHLPATGSVQVELVHGATNQLAFWLGLIAANHPVAPRAVYPDFTAFLSLVTGGLGMDRSAELGASGLISRVLTSAAQLTEPAVRATLPALEANGLNVRTVGSLPGYFYVDEAGIAVVPLEWGEALPTSIVITRERPVVDALVAYFDHLWSRASSVGGATDDRDAVLTLLAQGLPDGAIAAALGSSVRTVRRRIAEAGAEFGAANRFALGVEWQRRRPT